MPRFTSRTLSALALTLVLWASAFAGIRAGLRAYSPANLAVLRFLIASAVLGIYAAVAHFRRPKFRDIPGLILSGAIGISFYNLALNYGETPRDRRSSQPPDRFDPNLDRSRSPVLAARKTQCNWMGWRFCELRRRRPDRHRRRRRHSLIDPGIDHPGSRDHVRHIHDSAEALSRQL